MIYKYIFINEIKHMLGLGLGLNTKVEDSQHEVYARFTSQGQDEKEFHAIHPWEYKFFYSPYKLIINIFTHIYFQKSSQHLQYYYIINNYHYDLNW